MEMSTTYLRTAALAVAGLMFVATPSFADHDRRDHGRNNRGHQPVVRGQQVVVGRAVPRVYAPRYVAPHYIRPTAAGVDPTGPSITPIARGSTLASPPAVRTTAVRTTAVRTTVIQPTVRTRTRRLRRDTFRQSPAEPRAGRGPGRVRKSA